MLFPTTEVINNYSDNKSLNPNFITGFVDYPPTLREGCFFIGLNVSKKYLTGYQVQAIFQINLHKNDSALLSKIRSYFGVGGKISKHGKTTVYLRVTSIKDLKIIISHFGKGKKKYPLSSQKHAEFLLFKPAVELIQNKKHLTVEGLK
jgi:hypothetical protein